MQMNGSLLTRPVALLILDGWGYAPRTDRNAIAAAHTPYYDEICRDFPMTTLSASGEGVGLMPEEVGGSEVGHLNLGTGRRAQTEISKLQRAIASGRFSDNQVMTGAFERARQRGSGVHLVGLLSDGGVHSSAESLFALLRQAKEQGLKNVFIHCILDGVDVPTRTADVYVEALEIKLADIGIGKIATLCGRFFAMDASANWERTARAFTMLVHGEGERARDAVSAVRNSFLRGISDEFIAPVVIESQPDVPVASIKSGDLVVFFNHRGDAMRQLVRSLSLPEGASSAKPMIDTICLTEYDRNFSLPVAFPYESEQNTLGDTLTANQVRITKITETARFPHLTTYFDGGTDVSRPLDEDVLVPGTTPSNAAHQPESQSFRVTDSILREIEKGAGGVFVANLPAADLVAETGDFERTVSAIEYVDTCLGGIHAKMQAVGGVLLVTSAHGRCEEMGSRQPHESMPAQSTANPVPLHLVDYSDPHLKLRDDGVLADIAPTILAILGLEKPAEMTGTDLRVL
jgi:2,3-bisphosphoglycerate-independent phosphoglycerate mutase